MKTLMAILFVLSFNVLYSQKNAFEAGSILLENGDTLNGFIKNASDAENSLGVLYKQRINADAKFYDTKGTKAYSFLKGRLTFRKGTIRVYDFTLERFKDVERFGEVLVEGDLELSRFYLTTLQYDEEVVGSKNFLYVLKKDNQSYQIDQFRSVKVGSKRKVANSFRNVLNAVFADCDKISGKIKKASFSNSSLIDLLNAYKTCDSDLNLIISEKSNAPRAVIQSAVSVGLNFVGDDDFIDFKSYFIGYQGILYFTKRERKVSILLGIGYANQSFNFKGIRDISQHMMQGSLRVNFAPFYSDRTAIILGAGIESQNSIGFSSGTSGFGRNLFVAFNLAVQVKPMKLDLGYYFQPDELLFSPQKLYGIRLSYLL